jgi:ribosome biogenesis protein MAK21
MQPVLAASSAASVVISSKAGVRQQAMVNSATFWNLKQEQVAVEDVFFHEYFSQMGKPGQAAKAKKAQKTKEDGSEDEEAEDEIWEALVNSKPEVQGEEDEDSDMDMAAFDDDYSDISLDFDGPGGDFDDEEMPSDMGSDVSGGVFDESDMSGDGSVIEEEDDQPAPAATKPTAKDDKRRKHRKEIKSLPTFASAEDYAEMLAAEDGLDD